MPLDNSFIFTPCMVPIEPNHKWILYINNPFLHPIYIESIEAHYSGGSYEADHKRTGYLTLQSDFENSETIKNSKTLNDVLHNIIQAESWDGVAMGLFFNSEYKLDLEKSYPIIPGRTRINTMHKILPNGNLAIGAYTEKSESELSLIINGFLPKEENARINE